MNCCKCGEKIDGTTDPDNYHPMTHRQGKQLVCCSKCFKIWNEVYHPKMKNIGFERITEVWDELFDEFLKNNKCKEVVEFT